MKVGFQTTVHKNCFSLFHDSLTSPSPIHSAKSESIITQSEEKAEFVIIPSEGIENRTGTTSWVLGLVQGIALSLKSLGILATYL